jgi:DNA-directed RNA polymerase subunit RPC12/RpoP
MNSHTIRLIFVQTEVIYGGNSLVRGFCAKCGQEVGTLFKPKAWQCPSCKKVFCAACCPKVGLLIKKPACPDCGVECRG